MLGFVCNALLPPAWALPSWRLTGNCLAGLNSPMGSSAGTQKSHAPRLRAGALMQTHLATLSSAHCVLALKF